LSDRAIADWRLIEDWVIEQLVDSLRIGRVGDRVIQWPAQLSRPPAIAESPNRRIAESLNRSIAQSLN